MKAAPAGARARAQAAFEVRLLLSNGEQLLVSFVLPVMALVGLALTTAPTLGEPTAGSRISLAVPGVLALSVISSGFTAQAIATGFDRRYGVLRYLGVTPLGRDGLLRGKAIAALTVVAAQSAVVALVGLAFGWRPTALGIPLAAVWLVLGVGTFVALALWLAGTVRAEGVLALANLVWVVLVAVGGVIVPRAELPSSLAALDGLLPSSALGDGLRSALVDGQMALGPLVVLLVWGGVAAAAASRMFRWSD